MNLALFGASGRLGQAIVRLLEQQSELVLTQAIAHPRSSSLGQGKVPLQAAFEGAADLLCDVSLSDGFPASLRAALLIKKPLVIGTTGLSDAQQQELQRASSLLPIFYSPNFSVGMALFRRLACDAAKRFHASATYDLIETHHVRKKDAPSGTARQIEAELKMLGKEVRVHSIRAGCVIGEHQLLLNADEEHLEITHKAQSRDVFARGALAALRFIARQKPGLYGMDDLVL